MKENRPCPESSSKDIFLFLLVLNALFGNNNFLKAGRIRITILIILSLSKVKIFAILRLWDPKYVLTVRYKYNIKTS